MLDEYLAGRIDLDAYRGRSAYSFAVQAAERAVREATRTAGSTTSSSSARRRASASAPAGGPSRSRSSRRRASSPTSRATSGRSGTRGTTPQESFANQPPDQDEPALLVELAGQVAAVNGSRRRRSPPAPRACAGSSTCLPSNDERRRRRGRRSLWAAARAASPRSASRARAARRGGRRAPAGALRTNVARGAARDVVRLQPRRASREEIRAQLAVVGNRAAELDVVLALSSAARNASSQVWTLTPMVTWSESVSDVSAWCSQPRGR